MDRRNEEGNGRGEDNRDNDVNRGWNWWQTGAAVAGAAAVAVGGYYLLKKDTPSESTSVSPQTSSQRDVPERKGFLNSLADSLEAITGGTNTMNLESAISRQHVPPLPCITNLNSLLADIYVRHVAIKREDFQLHYRVFCEVFGHLHEQMKQVDKYYARYSSNVQFAGSHYDRLRINKPDEFDMDIVIGVPVNMRKSYVNPEESDIVIEPKYPGFVQLRAGTQYQNILIRDGPDCMINRTAYTWLDDKNYILRSKFTDWFKSVGNRALNQFRKVEGRPMCIVDGVVYKIRTTSSGPAWTIIIESGSFRLDVDLVPALKFPEDRWLEGKNYRSIPAECRRDYWMVVPKPNKAGATMHDELRSWRLALQDQEKQLLDKTYNLRQAVRLLKKFRDVQSMKGIASYYIKTLFFFEIMEQKHNPVFWQQDIGTLFKHMLRKFYDALVSGSIPFFWNKTCNMIENLNNNLRNEYIRKINDLIKVLQNPNDYRSVAMHLLTLEEYNSYKRFL